MHTLIPQAKITDPAKVHLTLAFLGEQNPEIKDKLVEIIEQSAKDISLFEVTPAVYHDAKDSVNNIVISRKNLVKFCVEKLDLKIGNKIRQQVDIPEWIKRNKKFQIACVRGLIDTDGSVIIHKYGVNGKLYNYKKLQFTSLSRPLLLSVYKILKDLEVNPRLARQKEVWIDSKMSVKKYFDIVGSHNLKHLNRYRN